jgi:hypothetical protein
MCLALVLLVSSVGGGTEISSVSQICLESKINSILISVMEKADPCERILVQIWKQDINQSAIEQQTEQTIGFTFNDLEVIKDEMSDELAVRFMVLSGGNSVDDRLERDLNNYISRTIEARALEQELTDAYIITRREISSEQYIVANDNFVSLMRVSSDDVVFRSEFAPMIIAELTVEEIYRTAALPQTNGIWLYVEEETINLTTWNPQESWYYRHRMSIAQMMDRFRINEVKSLLNIDGTGVHLGVIEDNTLNPSHFGFSIKPNRINVVGVPDNNNHATHVSIIAAGDNGIASGAEVTSSRSSLNGVEYAAFENLIKQGVTIINMSYKNAQSFLAMSGAPNIAWLNHIIATHHVTVLKGAGNVSWGGENTHPEFMDWSAISENVITVTAYQDVPLFLPKSDINYGSREQILYDYVFKHGGGNCFKPDLAAPANIVTLSSTLSHGTSTSTPFVSGIVALMQELRPSLKTQPQAVKAILMASCHSKAEPPKGSYHDSIDEHPPLIVPPPEALGCCFGGTIAPPLTPNFVNFLNGNTPNSNSQRGNLSVDVLELIDRTHIKSSDIYGVEVVTWGDNTENRQAFIDINGVPSPMFHAASAPNVSRICAVMEHGNTAGNGGRTKAQTLRYMNKYGGSPKAANNIVPLTPFISSTNPGNFNITIRPNDNHSSVVASITLLDKNEKPLGVATYATTDDYIQLPNEVIIPKPWVNNGVWGRFYASFVEGCEYAVEHMYQGLTEKQGAGIVDVYVALAITAQGNYIASTASSFSNPNEHKFTKKMYSETNGLNVSLAWLRDTIGDETVPPYHVNPIRQNLDLTLFLGNTEVGSSNFISSSTEMVYFDANNPHWGNWTSNNREFKVIIDRKTSAITPVRYAFAWSVNDEWIPEVTSPPIADGVYYVKSMNSNNFMDVSNGHTTNDTQVWQWEFNGTPAQQWRVTHTSSGYSLAPMHAQHMRLDALQQNNSTGGNGDRVRIMANNNSASQRFHFIPNSDGSYRIMPSYSTTHVVDVFGAFTSPSTHLHLWQWVNEPQQHWEFIRVT